LIRDLKWKLADRFPALDRAGLYRRPVRETPTLQGVDALLAAIGGVVLLGIGAVAIGFGLFVMTALILG